MTYANLFNLFYLFTNLQIGHYNLSVRIIDLVSHTTYVVCVNFIHKWRDLQLNVDSELQIFFKKLVMTILFTLKVFGQKSEKKKLPKKYFLYFVLMSSLSIESWLYV